MEEETLQEWAQRVADTIGDPTPEKVAELRRILGFAPEAEDDEEQAA